MKRKGPPDAEELKARVAAIGLSQSEVARRTGFTQTYVNKAWTFLTNGPRIWNAVRQLLPEWEAAAAEVEA